MSKDKSINHSYMRANTEEFENQGLQVEMEEEETLLDAERFDKIINVLSDLSNSIKELASATVNQKAPIVINLIANNDDDLNKFATIFAQGLK